MRGPGGCAGGAQTLGTAPHSLTCVRVAAALVHGGGTGKQLRPGEEGARASACPWSVLSGRGEMALRRLLAKSGGVRSHRANQMPVSAVTHGVPGTAPTHA